MAEQHTTHGMPAVTNNSAAGRFELRAGDQTAFLDYFISGGRIHLVHTEVPSALEGRGYGGQLARAGLDYAQREHLKVTPDCPFVGAYLERHPEYAALVQPDQP